MIYLLANFLYNRVLGTEYGQTQFVKTVHNLRIQTKDYKKYSNYSPVVRLLRSSLEKILRKRVNIEILINSVKRAEVEYHYFNKKFKR